jgi:hypothetical protein
MSHSQSDLTKLKLSNQTNTSSSTLQSKKSSKDFKIGHISASLFSHSTSNVNMSESLSNNNKTKQKPSTKIATRIHSKSKQDKLHSTPQASTTTTSLLRKKTTTSDNKKRDIVLIKHEQLGFGFIAGSEKPLVVRFVSPDGPGQAKLLNGDEILSINGEDVEFASRDYVVNLIRNSKDYLYLTVKQPTPRSTNSLLLTEDKKAFNKKCNRNRNKVRFRLEEENDNKIKDISNDNDYYDDLEEAKIQLGNEDDEDQLEEEEEEEDEEEEDSNYTESFDKETIKDIDMSLNTVNENENRFEYFKEMLDSLTKINNNYQLFDSSCSLTPTLTSTTTSGIGITLNNNNNNTNITMCESIYSLNDNINSFNCNNNNNEDSLILKVFIENRPVKKFRCDQNTSVRDVLNCLKEKLSFKSIDYFGLVLCLIPSESTTPCSNNSSSSSSNNKKFISLEETRHLFNLKEEYNLYNYHCMLRFIFVPSHFEELIENDLNSFNYLYEQVSYF